MRHKYVNWKWSNLKGCWYPNQMTKLIIHLSFIVPWWVLVNVGRLLESGTDILIDYQPGIMTNLVCWTWFSKSTISQRTGQRTVPSLASSFMKTAGSLRFFKGPGPLPHSKFSSQESEPAVLRFRIFFKGTEPTVLWSWNCWKNQNRRFFDPGIAERTRTDGSSTLAFWKNENRRLFEKSKNRPTPVHSHPACLLEGGMALILREKERKEKLGNFLWDQTKIAKECECGDLERERDGFLHPHLAAEKQSDPRTTLGTLWSEAVHAFVKLAWLPHRLSSACFGIFVLLLLTHYALHHYSPRFSIPTSPSQPALQLLLLLLLLVPVLLLSSCPAPGTQSYKPQWLAVGSEDCLEEDFG